MPPKKITGRAEINDANVIDTLKEINRGIRDLQGAVKKDVDLYFNVDGVDDLERAYDLIESFNKLKGHNKNNYFASQKQIIEELSDAYTEYSYKLSKGLDIKDSANKIGRWVNAYEALGYNIEKISKYKDISNTLTPEYSIKNFERLFAIMKEMQTIGFDMGHYSNMFVDKNNAKSIASELGKVINNIRKELSEISMDDIPKEMLKGYIETFGKIEGILSSFGLKMSDNFTNIFNDALIKVGKEYGVDVDNKSDIIAQMKNTAEYQKGIQLGNKLYETEQKITAEKIHQSNIDRNRFYQNRNDETKYNVHHKELKELDVDIEEIDEETEETTEHATQGGKKVDETIQQVTVDLTELLDLLKKIFDSFGEIDSETGLNKLTSTIIEANKQFDDMVNKLSTISSRLRDANFSKTVIDDESMLLSQKRQAKVDKVYADALSRTMKSYDKVMGIFSDNGVENPFTALWASSEQLQGMYSIPDALSDIYSRDAIQGLDKVEDKLRTVQELLNLVRDVASSNAKFDPFWKELLNTVDSIPKAQYGMSYVNSKKNEILDIKRGKEDQNNDRYASIIRELQTIQEILNNIAKDNPLVTAITEAISKLEEFSNTLIETFSKISVMADKIDIIPQNNATTVDSSESVENIEKEKDKFDELSSSVDEAALSKEKFDEANSDVAKGVDKSANKLDKEIDKFDEIKTVAESASDAVKDLMENASDNPEIRGNEIIKGFKDIQGLLNGRDIISQTNDKIVHTDIDPLTGDTTRYGRFAFVERLMDGRTQRVMAEFDDETGMWYETVMRVDTAFEQVGKEVLSLDEKIRKLIINRDKMISEHPGYNADADNRLIELAQQRRQVLLDTLVIYNDEEQYQYESLIFDQRRLENARRLDALQQQSQNKLDIKQQEKVQKADEARLKRIDRVNVALDTQKQKILDIQATYDKRINIGTTKPVVGEDLLDLSDQKNKIIAEINRIANTDASSVELSNIKNMIKEYQRMAKIKQGLQNVTKKELGAQEIEVVITRTIAQYTKLINKSKEYGNESHEITEELETQLSILEKKDINGKRTATVDDYYKAIALYKINKNQLDVIEEQFKEREKLVRVAEMEQKATDKTVKSLYDKLAEINKLKSNANSIQADIIKDTDGKRADELNGKLKETKDALAKAKEELVEIFKQVHNIQSKIDPTDYKNMRSDYRAGLAERGSVSSRGKIDDAKRYVVNEQNNETAKKEKDNQKELSKNIKESVDDFYNQIKKVEKAQTDLNNINAKIISSGGDDADALMGELKDAQVEIDNAKKHLEELYSSILSIQELASNPMMDLISEDFINTMNYRGSNESQGKLTSALNKKIKNDATDENTALVVTYKQLNAEAKEYFSLLEREQAGNISNYDQKRLDNLRQAYQDIINGSNKYNANLNATQKSIDLVNKEQSEFISAMSFEGVNGYIVDMIESLGKLETQMITLSKSPKFTTDFINTISDNISDIQTLSTQFSSLDINDLFNIDGTLDVNKLFTLINAFEDLNDRIVNLKKNATKNPFNLLGDTNKQLSKYLLDIEKTLQDSSAMPRRLRGEYDELKNKISDILENGNTKNVPKEQLLEIETELNKLNTELVHSGKNYKNLFSMLGERLRGINAQFIAQFFSIQDFIRYGREMANVIIGLDTALVDLRKTTTMNNIELDDFYLNSNKIAKSMGVTTQSIIEQAAAWSRLGYSSKEDVSTMAELSSQFASISPGMDTTTAQEGLVSTMKAFHKETNEVKRDIMDNINIIGNTMATSNKDIVDMLERSSAAMAAANNSIEQTIALESAAVEITQNAENTGTAFRTISMRIRGYDEDTEEWSEDLKNISGDIADLTKTADNTKGISLFDADDPTKYKSTYQILKEISEIYGDLTDKQQAQLLEKLGGKRGGQVLAGLLEDFSGAEKALKNMEGAEGSADAEMGIVKDSIEYKINELKETWTGFLMELLNRKDVGELVDSAISASESLQGAIEPLAQSLKLLLDVLSPLLEGFGKFAELTGGLSIPLLGLGAGTVKHSVNKMNGKSDIWDLISGYMPKNIDFSNLKSKDVKGLNKNNITNIIPIPTEEELMDSAKGWLELAHQTEDDIDNYVDVVSDKLLDAEFRGFNLDAVDDLKLYRKQQSILKGNLDEFNLKDKNLSQDIAETIFSMDNVNDEDLIKNLKLNNHQKKSISQRLELLRKDAIDTNNLESSWMNLANAGSGFDEKEFLDTKKIKERTKKVEEEKLKARQEILNEYKLKNPTSEDIEKQFKEEQEKAKKEIFENYQKKNPTEETALNNLKQKQDEINGRIVESIPSSEISETVSDAIENGIGNGFESSDDYLDALLSLDIDTSDINKGFDSLSENMQDVSNVAEDISDSFDNNPFGNVIEDLEELNDLYSSTNENMHEIGNVEIPMPTDDLEEFNELLGGASDATEELARSKESCIEASELDEAAQILDAEATKVNTVETEENSVADVKETIAEETQDAITSKGAISQGEDAVATVANTVATNGLTAAIKANIAALGAQTAAMVTFLLTNPIGWAIDAAVLIFAVVKAYDALTVSVEEATGYMDNWNSELDKMKSNLKSQKDLVDKAKQSYDKLAEGVNTFNNTKLNLSDEEYAEFIELNNKLAETFPELKTGVDKEGNAILNLGKSSKTTAEQLDELIKRQERLQNLEIANNIGNVWDNTKVLLENDEEQITQLTEDIAKYEDMISNFNGNGSLSFNLDDDIEIIRDGSLLNSEIGTLLTNSINQLEQELWEADVDRSAIDRLSMVLQTDKSTGNFDEFGNEIYEWYLNSSMLTPEQKTRLNEILEDNSVQLGIDLKESLFAMQDELTTANISKNKNWDSFINDNIVPALHTKNGFYQLSETGQEMADAIVSGLDIGIMNNIGNENPLDYITNWMYAKTKDGKFIMDDIAEQTFKSLDNKELSFEDLFTGELSNDELTNLYSQIQEYFKANGIEIKFTIGEQAQAEKSAFSSRNSAITSQAYTESFRKGENESQKLREFTKDFSDEQKKAWVEVTEGAENAQEAIDKWNEYLETSEEITDKIADNVSKFNVKDLEDTVSSLKTINGLYNTLLENEKAGKTGTKLAFGISDIENLKDQIKDADGNAIDLDEYAKQNPEFTRRFKDYEKVLTEGTASAEEMKDALNGMSTIFADVMLEEGDYSEKTKQLVKTQLELAGATKESAEAYVEYKTKISNAKKELSEMKSFSVEISESSNKNNIVSLQKIFGKKMSDFEDMQNAYEELIQKTSKFVIDGDAIEIEGFEDIDTAEAVQALLNEAEAAGYDTQALATLAFQRLVTGDNTLETAQDCQNLKNLASQAGVTGKVIDYLSQLMSIYAQMETAIINKQYPLVSALESRANELKALIDAAATQTTQEIENPIINSPADTKAAGGAGKEAADAYVEAFEKELEQLEKLKDAGVISEKEYLDRLKALYIKYFANKKQYYEKFRQYEKQYLEGMQSLYSAAISGAKTILNHQIDDLQEQKDAAIEALEEEKEAATKAIQDQIDALEDQKEALEKANEARERAINLQKQQYELERAQSQRTRLVKINARGYSNVA